jgi:nucleotide-binding universal stress UspA family protein
MSGIIVGVDGSDHSRHALRWAMHEAELRHVPLTVMTVRPDPVRPATTIYWGLHTLPENSHNQDLVRKAVQEFVDKVASEIGGTVPEVTVSVATGNPVEELVKASRDADMLVVGSRGSGGFGRLMLGSVSSQVTHHARCPVVVIPGTRQAS